MRRGWLLRVGWVVFCAWSATTSRGLAEPSAASRSGQLEVVTYNVAGLPEGLSNVHPTASLPVVGGLLNKFDLAFVQEDFAYPELLRQRLRLPYRSPAFVRGKALHFGDGLSLFSKYPFGDLTRAAWAECHGVWDSYSDCLTPKGLAFTRLEVAAGALLDVYDVHLDAGHADGDVQARSAQLRQLLATIERSSKDRTLVLGGDFNLTHEELPTFRELMHAAGFVDACDELHCGQPGRIDRILFRNGGSVRLSARSWKVGTGFRDSQGHALSDHEPVVVQLGWSIK